MTSSFSEPPLFTILIATKNDGLALKSCLHSLSEQTFESFEVIVKDGFSSDDTEQVIEEASEALGNRLKFITKEDTSITQAWNEGLQHCIGEWLYVMGADDTLHSRDTLQNVAAHISANRDTAADIYFGAVELVSDPEFVGATWIPSEGDVLGKITAEMPVSHQALFVRRGIAFQISFDEQWKLAADYDFLIRAVFDRGVKMRALSEKPLLISRVCTDGLSGDPVNSLKVLMEYRAIQRRAGLPARRRWLWAVVKSYIKIGLIRAVGRNAGAVTIDLYRILSGRKPRHSRQKC